MTNPTQPAEGMPERWQLVPVKPTPEMLQAAECAYVKDAFGAKTAWPSDIFRAMCAAAPKAPPMPELPEPATHIDWPSSPYEPVFTTDQMREYGRQCAEAASAKCARHGAYMCVACRKGEAAPKAPPMPDDLKKLARYLIDLHQRCKDHEDAGFPIDDPYDTYPHELWQAMSSPDRLKPLLDWLAAQGFTKE